jgi:hypothetical protein
MTNLAQQITNGIRPLLVGHPPEVQGIVLADLVATFIAGHHPAVRDDTLDLLFDCVRALVPCNEKKIFPDSFPVDWN